MDSNTSATVEPIKMYDYLNGMAENPIIFAILVLVIIAYLIFFMSLGNQGSGINTSSTNSLLDNSQVQNNSTSGSGFMTIIILVLFMLIVYNVLKYFFSIDIIASVNNLLKGGNQIDIAINKETPLQQDDSVNNKPEPEPIPEITRKPQVFNIPGNYYNYNDAKALCSAYGAKLANYNQIEKAYDEGAEYCNYGWSEGQMALFPTQKDTFNKLQKVEGHENDCGRPGVNGGYMANPELKFGVNCFGYKPKITSEEEELMHNITSYPKSQKDILMEQKVDYWKSKLDEILVSPFNHNTWSKI